MHGGVQYIYDELLCLGVHLEDLEASLFEKQCFVLRAVVAVLQHAPCRGVSSPNHANKEACNKTSPRSTARLTCQRACPGLVAALPPHPRHSSYMWTCRCTKIASCRAVAAYLGGSC